METYKIIKRVLLTEKSTTLKDDNNHYAFVVDSRANKIEIGQAVEKLFKVKVLKVRTMNMQGKTKRVGKTVGQKADWKKAVVTLAEGNRVEIFEGV
jgi:large subunit ribosomal protein L23